MTRTISNLILLALFLSIPAVLRAESAPRAGGRGFLVGLGAGWGSFGASDCPACPRTAGLSGYLDLGVETSDQVRLGLITTAWMKREDPSTTVATGNASGAVTFFALPGGGLFARLGVGLATYIIDGEVETGLGILAGTGYEFRPARSLGVGPYLIWYHGDFDRFGASVVQLGIAVTAL